MKTKILFSAIALFILFIQNGNAATRCCSPADLTVTATAGNAVRLTFSWTSSYSPAGCIQPIWFQVKVHVRGPGGNYWLELSAPNGPGQVSVEADVAAQSSITWKVRGMYGNQNGLYHSNSGGILPSHWVGGPGISEANARMELPQTEADAGGLNVFPNPLTGHNLQVKIKSDNETQATLEIIDGVGKVVKQEAFMLYGGSNLAAIDVKELHSGIYVVRVSSGDKIRTVRFMVR